MSSDTDNDKLSIIPERDEVMPARKPAPEIKSGGKSGVLWGAVVLLTGAVAGLGYQYLQLSELIARQEAQIQKQIQFQVKPVSERLNQEAEALSKASEKTESRLSALENTLAATGKDLSASGSALEKRVSTSEHEIRKLWDLSNKRNKVNITKQQALLARYKKDLDQLSGQLTALQTATEEHKTNIKVELAAVGTTLTRLESADSELSGGQRRLGVDLAEVSRKHSGLETGQSDQLKQIARLSERLDLLKGALSVIQKEQKGLSGQKKQLTQLEQQMVRLDNHDQTEVKIRLDEYAERLDAIDAARRQLTTNITRLNTDVNRIQLTLKSIEQQ